MFYAALGPQLASIRDATLDRIDGLLADPALIELALKALAGRRPRSATTGRPGLAPDRVLRLCVLKHLRQWSFRELEREVRGSTLYRRFCRIDHEDVPDASTLCRNISCLDVAVMRTVNGHLVERALSECVVSGKKVRIDTTVVETNVHYPTDSTLLADAIRVVVRSLHRLGFFVRNPKTAVKRRLLEINRAASCRNEAGHQRLLSAYRRLLRIARRASRQGWSSVGVRARTSLQRRARIELRRRSHPHALPGQGSQADGVWTARSSR